MKSDPMEHVGVNTLRPPPMRGAGSGKEAWVQFARQCAAGVRDNKAIIEEQTETIRDLKAEIELLRAQLAKRSPVGRPRLADDVVERIELDLAAGFSIRKIADGRGVSRQTVLRIKQRVAERAKITG